MRSAALASLLVLAACGPAHIEDYAPKRRTLDTSITTPPERPGASDGSLWRPGDVGASLFMDARAFRESDIIIVRVDEVADAERSAKTDVGRRSNTALGLAAVPIIGAIANAATNINATAGATSDGSFTGGGSTNRSEKLLATVSAVVKKVLPNGNLFIEGSRVILVNNEEHHLYVSGIVRPIDIDEENGIASSRIAEAEIEFVGRGVVSDNQQQGLVGRFLHVIWPF